MEIQLVQIEAALHGFIPDPILSLSYVKSDLEFAD